MGRRAIRKIFLGTALFRIFHDYDELQQQT
jgi:hypothetical protein